VDLVSELCTRMPSAAKWMADELQSGRRTVYCPFVSLVCLYLTLPLDKQTIIMLLFWSVWGRRAGSGETWTSFFGEQRLYVARVPGVALLFNGDDSTGNEDLGERCLHETVICSQQYRSFLWQ